MKSTNSKTKKIVLTGMFAAIVAILSQFSIPMPAGVPITLQTFAVALTAYVLGWKLGTAAIGVYILLGAIGLPVFAGFTGGADRLVNMTGGFIWGFLVMAAFCGIAMNYYTKKTVMGKAVGIALGLLGLAGCHLLGVLQFSVVTGMSFGKAFLLVSLPYLVKDVISVVIGFVLAAALRRVLNKAGVFSIEMA